MNWNATCTFTLLVVKGGTPCTSILQVAERDIQGIYILLLVEGEPPCTSILLVVEGDIPWACPRCWQWKGDTLHVHTAGFGRGDTSVADP